MKKTNNQSYYDIEAEEILLAASIHNRGLALNPEFSASLFSNERVGLCRAIKAVTRKDEEITTKHLELEGAGDAELASYDVVRAIDEYPDTHKAEILIETLTNLNLRRHACNAMRQLHEDASGLESKELMQRINELATSSQTILDGRMGKDLVDGSDINDLLDAIKKRIENPELLAGISCGMGFALDRILDGLGPGRLILVAGRPHTGKAQPLWAKVLTPSGFVEMGSLSVGDDVIGLNGKPRKIVGVFPQGEKEVFKITMSDGSATHACADHLWSTQTRNEKRRETSSVKTTADIAKTIRRGDGGRWNHKLPQQPIVEFNPAGDLPLHPWLLGALIGDGTLGSGNVMFDKPEEDVLRKVESLLPSQDMPVRTRDQIRVKRRGMRGVTETMLAIRGLGLNVKSYKKFIPRCYLYSSIKDRWELLRGLVDTDGSVSLTGIDYSTSSERLASDFMFLCGSLGIKCTVSDRITNYTYLGEKLQGRRSWRIRFRATPECFSSDKHKSRVTFAIKKPLQRGVESVESVGFDECQCISVDAEDGIYLTDDFIPTHNTSLGMTIAKGAMEDGHRVAYFSAEMTVLNIQQALLDMTSGVQIRSGEIPSKGDLIKIRDAAAKIKQMKFHIDDGDRITINSICAKARALHRRKGLDLLVVDYAQIIGGSDVKDDMRLMIAEISGKCKALAKELGIPVILMSQVNRATPRTDPATGGNVYPKPTLSNLKESSSLESDADVVLLIDRNLEAEDPTVEEVEATIIIAKNRCTGILVDVPANFNRRDRTFTVKKFFTI